MSYSKTVFAVALAGLCTACGPTAQSPDTVLMTIQNGGQSMTGTYRTDGFSQGQVRSMVGRICTSAGFSGYNQSVNGNIASFSAGCAASTKYATGGSATFSRQEDGSITYVVRYSQNGRSLQEDGVLNL